MVTFRSRSSLTDLGADLRLAVRALRRSPLFAVSATLALALGIGASTAIFGVVDAILLRPLAYARADRLVVILHEGRKPVSPANLLDWRRDMRGFSHMAAAEAWGATLTGLEFPERVRALRVTPDMFPLLGVEPLVGRTLSTDGRAEREVVLSYDLWQRRFAGDRAVLGRSLMLDGEPHVVTGVMPRTFQFAPFWATHTELWAPLDLASRAASRNAQSLRVFARLGPGVHLAQARASAAATTARLEREFPGTNGDVVVTPLHETVVGDVRPMLLVLLGAVGLLLLASCANVAHLLLARGGVRRRELALRTALGADRGRLVRQLLTESAVLAALGGAFGAALGWAGMRLLVAFGPVELPRLATAEPDGRVLLAAFGTAALTAIACGLLPAWRSTDGMEAALRGGRQAIGGRPQHRLRRSLVTSEFAMALVLLVGAGLMVRSIIALQATDPGFEPRGLLVAEVAITGSAQAAPGRRSPFFLDLVQRIEAIPGVRSASAINHAPLAGDVWGRSFSVEGTPDAERESRSATYRTALPGYFRTMGIRLLEGRDFTARDAAGAPGVVVVNESMARQHWPGRSAVGQRIAFGSADDREWLTVIGVIGNVVRGDWVAPASEELYTAYLQDAQYQERQGPAFTSLTLVVRADGDAGALAAAVRAAVRAIDDDLPVSGVQSMSAVVREATARQRFLLALLAAFAGASVVLAAIGVYGATSYAMVQRIPEIGIRMALGATPRDVVALVAREGMVPALAGTAIGGACALALARVARGLLFGVPAHDPATFVAVALCIVVVAGVASWLPSRRAIRVDPNVALRGG
jgi:putative ABC transport system permease protein